MQVKALACELPTRHGAPLAHWSIGALASATRASGRVAALCTAGALTVYAWALLPNHFHLLLRTGRQPLAAAMRRLLPGCAVHFNRRRQRYT